MVIGSLLLWQIENNRKYAWFFELLVLFQREREEHTIHVKLKRERIDSGKRQTLKEQNFMSNKGKQRILVSQV